MESRSVINKNEDPLLHYFRMMEEGDALQQTHTYLPASKVNQEGSRP